MHRFRLRGTAVMLTLLAACGKNDVDISSDAVVVKTTDLDIRFSRSAPWSEGYLIFGGLYADLDNSTHKITLAGLELNEARRLAAAYPDFHRCSSRGASAAQSRIVQLNLIAADSGTLHTLKDALDEFNANLQRGGDRVCVRMEGSTLRMEAAIAREVGEDIKEHYAGRSFFLVTSASKMTGQAALAGQ